MSKRPSVAETLTPLLAGYPVQEQRVLVALAERVAAGRYRAWAEEVDRADLETLLRACAEREEEIASRVEALDPDASGIQERFRREHPELEEGYVALFAGLPLREQWAVQAEGERAGAAAWRGFAEACEKPEDAATLRSCAPLEEQNAEALEAAVRMLG